MDLHQCAGADWVGIHVPVPARVAEAALAVDGVLCDSGALLGGLCALSQTVGGPGSGEGASAGELGSAQRLCIALGKEHQRRGAVRPMVPESVPAGQWKTV